MKVSGKTMLMFVNGVAIGGTKSFTLDVEVDNPDATTKDDDAWGNSIYGSKKWTGSFDALYDPTAVYGLEEFFDAIDADTTVILEYAVITPSGGGLVLRGSANIGGLSITAGLTDPVGWSGKVTSAGPLVRGTVTAS